MLYFPSVCYYHLLFCLSMCNSSVWMTDSPGPFFLPFSDVGTRILQDLMQDFHICPIMLLPLISPWFAPPCYMSSIATGLFYLYMHCECLNQIKYIAEHFITFVPQTSYTHVSAHTHLYSTIVCIFQLDLLLLQKCRRTVSISLFNFLKCLKLG